MNTDYRLIESPASISMHSYVGDMQGCGHIRIIFPALLLNHLRLPGYRFLSTYCSHFINDLKYYKSFTFVQFQRAATPQHLNLIQHFITNIKRNMKTPLIYEIDDLLMGIPEWNRASEYYDKCVEPIKKIMSVVDGMTVSTNKLKEVYGEYCKNIIVIPNHLPKFLWGDVSYKGNRSGISSKPRILYQGSDNHFCTKALAKKGLTGGDFGDVFLDYIKKTLNKYQWVFMGGYPLELDSLIGAGKIEYHMWKHILEYPSYIKTLNPDICIAPLKQNLFNESKSNIKNLEYVALGAPAIYTDIEPYKHTTIKVKTDEEMISKIEELVENPDLRFETWKTDYDAVKEQLFWEENDNMKKYINSYLGLFKRKI